MNAGEFRDVALELAEENPLAIRPLLRLLAIRFTTEVPTLAVTCGDRPELLVNLPFVTEHCQSEGEVKAVILHELLHIVLRHTEGRGPQTNAEHLAMDAVINAIIHRQYGLAATEMMARYYRDAVGAMRLLRPRRADDPRDEVWDALYEGKLVVDDIRELAESLGDLHSDVCGALLGGHGCSETLGEPLGKAADSVLRAMNGAGVWRGTAAPATTAIFNSSNIAIRNWRRKTLPVLRRHIVPDRRSRVSDHHAVDAFLPVLSPNDRRAFLRSMWSPFLPESTWRIEAPLPRGTTNVYLDVSGSMWPELPHIVALLQLLRRYIRKPLLSFSTEVEVARLCNGRLVAKSTGGTSIECLLRHLAATRPMSAVIVTDGHIEEVQQSWKAAIGATKLHAIVTRDGSTRLLDRAGIPATQLEALP